MKRYYTFLVIFLCLNQVSALGALESLSKDIKFHVATNGNDSWSGALAKSVIVLIREGIHFLDETLIFKPEDSGTDENPITYKAYPGENPIISGGKLVSGWQQKGANNFSLRKESPALKLGFKPIDMTTVGPRSRQRINSRTNSSHHLVLNTVKRDTPAIDIETADGPEASWAMPFLTPGGRVYEGRNPAFLLSGVETVFTISR